MKKLLAVVLAAVMALSLAACSDSAKKIDTSKMDEQYENCGLLNPAEMDGVTIGDSFKTKNSDTKKESFPSAGSDVYYELIGLGEDQAAAQALVQQYTDGLQLNGVTLTDIEYGGWAVYENDKCYTYVIDVTDDTLGTGTLEGIPTDMPDSVKGQYGMYVFVVPKA